MLQDFQIRPLTATDVEPVGVIIYETMAAAYRDHGLLEPIADADAGAAMARNYLELDADDSIVATQHERIVGAGFLHRRHPVASIGPLVVAPAAQGQGIGTMLLADLVESTVGCDSIHAHVDSFATRALGMAHNLGFEVRGSALQMVALGGLHGRGRPLAASDTVTPAIESSDLAALAAYDATGFGGSRKRDFTQLLAGGDGLLVREAGEIRGFLLGRIEESLALLGPGAADTPELMALLMARLGESLEKQATIIRTALPARPAALVQTALEMGFRLTSTSLCLGRGKDVPGSRATVIGMPADIV